jgi:hypothetical protein
MEDIKALQQKYPNAIDIFDQKEFQLLQNQRYEESITKQLAQSRLKREKTSKAQETLKEMLRRLLEVSGKMIGEPVAKAKDQPQ